MPDICTAIKGFHTRDQQICRFTGTIESVYIRKSSNPRGLAWDRKILRYQYYCRGEKKCKTRKVVINWLFFTFEDTAARPKFSPATWPSCYPIAAIWWNVSQKIDARLSRQLLLTIRLSRKWRSWRHGYTKRTKKLVSNKNKTLERIVQWL